MMFSMSFYPVYTQQRFWLVPPSGYTLASSRFNADPNTYYRRQRSTGRSPLGPLAGNPSGIVGV